MPSNEGHVHWASLVRATTVNFANQDLELTIGREGDPEGCVRVRALGSDAEGLHIPTDGWEAVPGTSPALEARSDANDPIGFLRLREA